MVQPFSCLPDITWDTTKNEANAGKEKKIADNLEDRR